MRFGLAAALLTLALCGAPLARADVLLLGSQHIGDNHNDSAFTPADAVTRDQMVAFPTTFHLSQQTTITAVELQNPVSLDNRPEAMFINGVNRPRDTSTATALNVWKLASPLVLDAGIHTIAPRPVCFIVESDVCVEEDDIGFSAIRLESPQTSTSRMLSRRRSIGDDNDADDNYDIVGTGSSRWYPDRHEGAAIEIAFSTDAERILSAVNFYRLRDVAGNNSIRARALVDGQFIGEITGNGEPGPFRLLASIKLAAGAHTLRIESGNNPGGDRDTISWNDIILFFGTNPGGTPGSFNAVDLGDDAVGGRLTTRIAGVSSAIDIVALNLARDGANPSYTGSVTAELLDASNSSGPLDANGCRSTWVPANPALSGTALFPGGGNGRVTLPTITYSEVLREARVRMTDTNGLRACSTDAFAIRPDRFSVSVSDGGPTVSGTSRSLMDLGVGGPVTHRAGHPFTVRVTARAFGGATVNQYVGTPFLSLDSVVQGPTAGTLTVDGWSGSGTRRTDNARYSEAGTFQLVARDDSWAAIDAADTDAADRTVLSAATGAGRFTPDRFRLLSRVDPILQPACGSFGYLGQPMNYATAPSLILEAINAAGGRVRNYGNSQLFKLPGALPLANYQYRGADAAGASLALGTVLPSPDNGIANLGDGTARLSFSASPQLSVLRTTPVAPFTPKLALEVLALSDSDGVAVDSPSSLSFGSTAVAGAGIAFAGGAAEQRFGRLVLEPGYGPELQALRMDYGSEYFLSATAGFVRSLGDSCTLAPTIALDPTGYTTAAIVPGFVAGRGRVELAAPGASGRVTVQLTPAGWLLTDLDGDGYDDPATAVATFGTFRGGDRRIYQRETYR